MLLGAFAAYVFRLEKNQIVTIGIGKKFENINRKSIKILLIIFFVSQKQECKTLELLFS
jgi:hypothetical protein